MIKASALYIVIIIALVIGVLCSALIATAYYYKATYQKKFRYDLLDNNLTSAINILLAGQDTAYIDQRAFSLFGGDDDSVSLKRIPWGLYDVGVAQSFIQKDTLFRTFSIAPLIDSAKWCALYLIDEDRLLSVSGKTAIRGNAFIPKAGIKPAYVDNKAYEGDKRLIIGKQFTSAKTLPPLDTGRFKNLADLKNSKSENVMILLKSDSLRNSFKMPARIFNFGLQAQTLQNITASGNIVLLSDTTIVIDSTAHLNNVVVYAKAIFVKENFHGTCQLFATDSITVQRECRFDYPSVLGVFRLKTKKMDQRVKLNIGEKSSFTGIIFSYEKADNKLAPLIQIGKSAKISGQIYSQDALELTDGDEIDGSVFTGRFLYRNNFTHFENYLINVTLSTQALSPYYLTSSLTPVSGKKRKVLQWLEQN